MSMISNCCGGQVLDDSDICLDCHEHCEAIDEDATNGAAGPLIKKLNLTVDNEYVQEQIAVYLAKQERSVEQVIAGKENWEEGVGSFITLRAYRGSNEKAGTLSLSQSITWSE